MRVKKMASWLIVALIVATGLLAACSTPEPVQAPPAEAQPTNTQPVATPQEKQPTVPPTKPAQLAPTWKADGVVSEGEYNHEATMGKVKLWWRNDAESLYLAMEAPTTGWVAVGIDPTDRMKGANYILGEVTDGKAQIWDAYGTAPTGATHPPDTDLGGTNDIVAYAGVEEEGITRFEVQIPLDSGDKYDRPLKPGGTYPVIVAMGGSDSYNSYHASKASGKITLD